MAFDQLTTETVGHQYRVTFDRPEKLNAVDTHGIDELNEVITHFQDADDLHVLVFTGAGNAFSVGADIAEFGDWILNEQWERVMTFLRTGQQMVHRIAELEKPTMVAIDGYALGGGLEISLACDFRFAAESATLGVPEIDIGMIPGWGGTQRLAGVVGESTAKDMLLTGRHVDAQEAASLGLVDRVVGEDELAETTDEFAKALAAKPQTTLRYMLQSVEASLETPIDEGLDVEMLCNMFSATSDETAVRMDEFIND